MYLLCQVIAKDTAKLVKRGLWQHLFKNNTIMYSTLLRNPAQVQARKSEGAALFLPPSSATEGKRIGRQSGCFEWMVGGR